MSLNSNIRLTIFEITFQRILNYNSTSVNRASRNLIEATNLISPKKHSIIQLKTDCEDLTQLMNSVSDKNLIKDWLIQTFELD